jgi:hypothetical protein
MWAATALATFGQLGISGETVETHIRSAANAGPFAALGR